MNGQGRHHRHRRSRVAAAIAAVGSALALAACGSNGPGTGTGGKASGDAKPAASGLRVAMVTHGDSGAYWSIVKRGAEAGAKDLGIELNYAESANDPQKQTQLIEAAITQKPDGLAVSAPNPEAIKGALEQATKAGIPVVVLNSGVDQFAQLGAIAGVGQDPTIAGEAVGARLKKEGVKKVLCVLHEQSNVELQARCDGVKDGLGGAFVATNVAGNKDVATSTNEIKSKLQADGAIDAVVTLDPEMALATKSAVAGAGRKVRVATFDLSGDIAKAIQDGSVEFAVDQQPYLQGYLPLTLFKLYKSTGTVVGGGRTVLTGPGIVDAKNAAQVEKLAGAGIR
jgi:simple sugar transport system substrate-binding protein